MTAWHWVEDVFSTALAGGRWHLRDGRGRVRASVWGNVGGRFTWCTFNADDIGGENGEAATLDDAKLFAVGCLVRQGWAPGGWKIMWTGAKQR